jgi:anthranilate synthase
MKQPCLFKGLPHSFEVGRYHSLFALPENMPQELKVTALSKDGVIMAVEHCKLPIAGVQFHPESIMSLAGGAGLAIIQDVVRTYAGVKVSSILIV